MLTFPQLFSDDLRDLIAEAGDTVTLAHQLDLPVSRLRAQKKNPTPELLRLAWLASPAGRHQTAADAEHLVRLQRSQINDLEDQIQRLERLLEATLAERASRAANDPVKFGPRDPADQNSQRAPVTLSRHPTAPRRSTHRG